MKTPDERAAIVALVSEVGQKEAARRMGCSVSYLLKVAPEIKTAAQRDFDAKEDGHLGPTGHYRGERPKTI